MHHHNCFVISAIARRLNSELSNLYLVKCFSNSIDELYFEFNQFSFRCIFYKGEMFFSFDNDLIGENRLFKPQFKEIVNAQVSSVVFHPYERSFHIEFSNQLKLIFKCFGRKSNVILFSEGAVCDIFRKNIDTDNSLEWNNLLREIQPVFNLEKCSDEDSFNSEYAYLPKEFYRHLKPLLTENNFDTILHQFANCQSFEINEEVLDLRPDFNSAKNNVLETTTCFTSAYLKSKIFSEHKNELIQKFSTLLKEKENYLKANSTALKKMINSRKEEEIGNIILANLHQIKGGEKKITVHDVYHDQPIEIKMDEHLSALKNADVYFKKDKARPFIIKQLEGKISQSTIEIEKLKLNLAAAENANYLKDLKLFTKNKKGTLENIHLPYKYFKIEGYEILVGKHAESNEKLLNYYSDKDDIWLHAKDVGGSHVIIKTHKNKVIPDSILEKAAGIAAYFSKSRNQGLATVIYTQRKFVRKIKGADKGKVTVTNEKSILVNPAVFKA